MIQKSTLTLLFIAFLCSLSYTQSSPHSNKYSFENDHLGFSQLRKHQFSDGTITGKLHKMGHVFEDNEELKGLFEEFDRARKSQKSGNVTALVITGVGIGAANGFSSLAGDNEISAFALVFGLGGPIVGIITALVANTSSKSKKNKKRKLLLSKLDGSTSSLLYHKPKVDFGVTNHGLGLVIGF